MVSKAHKLWVSFKFCLPVAIIIFITSLLAEFSVRIYDWGLTDWKLAIFAPLLGILGITACLMFLVWDSPRIRKAIANLTGWSDE